MKRLIPAAFLLVLAACGSGSGPTTPTTPTPPVQTSFSLSGGLFDSKVASNKVPGATLTIADGANAGKTTVSDGSGNYRMTGVMPGGFTMTISSTAEYVGKAFSVAMPSADTVVNFRLDPVPPPIFTRSGVGNMVFDMPTYVSRVRIQASYPDRCQNFVVLIAGRLIVNEILGTCSIASGRSYDGTHTTSGGVVETQISTGVSWTFTEVR